MISYQTAYLKAHFPVEFMAGLLSNEINNTDKISIFVGECKRMGVPILPPDMNRSSLKFTPEGGSSIRYGLAAIKNVGEGAMALAIAERERNGDFSSLEDICSRVDSRIANRKILESLVKAGAFDFLGRDRAELFACTEETLASAASSHRDRASGQVSLFGDMPAAPIARRTHEFTPWTEREKLSYEKELLGFYVTGHPLDAYAPLFASGKYQTIASLREVSDRAAFRVAGAIAQVDRKFTKKDGKPFAVVFIEDLSGILEVVLWSETYMPVAGALELGTVIAIRGMVDRRDDSVRATAQKVKVITPEIVAKAGAIGAPRICEEGPLTLRFGAGIAADELRRVREILVSSPGAQPVTLMLTSQNGEKVWIDAGDPFRVDLTPGIEQQLAPWL